MATRNLYATPPFKSPVTTPERTVTLSWQTYVNALSRLTKVRIADAAYDPGSLASGAAVTVSVTVHGARLGDFAVASFTAPDSGVVLLAQVTAADTASVTFLNLSAGAVDLAAGTLRVRVEMQA